MYPGQFYTKQFTGINLKRGKARYQGRSSLKSISDHFFNGTIPMKYINDLPVPTENEIIQAQLSNIKKNFPINIALTNSLNKLAEDRESFYMHNIDGKQINTEDMVNIIEKVFSKTAINEQNQGSGMFEKNGAMLELLSHRINAQDYANGLTQYYNALNKLREAYNLFESDKVFIKEGEISSIISKLKNAIQMLESDLENAKNGIFESDAILQEKGYIWSNKDKSGDAYHGSIIGYGNILKGRFIERRAMDFLTNKVVIPDKNITFVDTANIKMRGTINLSGNNRANAGNSLIKVRSDIVALDKDIKISYIFKGEHKNNASLEEFLKDCALANGGNDYIEVTVDEWKEILNKSEGAFQVKSGHDQSPISDFSTTAPEVYAKVPQYFGFLARMVSWYSYGNIYANAPELDAIFNYGIAHATLYIIGLGNNYLVLRNRITPTYDYFVEQIALGRYLRGGTPVSLSNPNANIQVRLSKSFPFSYSNNI